MAVKADSKDLAMYQQQLPGKLGEAMQMATILAKSGVVPASYAGKPEAVFAIVQYGKELGVPPMVALQNMSYINGKPSMGSDLLAALAHKHPDWSGYEVKKLTDEACELIVYRKNPNDPKKPFSFPGTFTMQEARSAGLVRAGGPWEKWKRRMLKHRAFAFALRDAFPDAFSGLYTDEEMEPDTAAMKEGDIALAQDGFLAEALEEDGTVKDLPVKSKESVKKTVAKTTGTRYAKGKKA